MWPCIALSSALAASPALLADVGEELAGLVVAEVRTHPEYQRIDVTLEDERTLTLEVNAADAGTGACHHHGLSVFPRWELLDEEVALEDQPPVVTALCSRLEARGASLKLSPPRGTDDRPREMPEPAPEGPALGPSWTLPDTEVAPPPGWLDRSLQALLVLLIAASVLTLGRHRPTRRELAEVIGLTLLAGTLRLALSPRTIMWGPFFGYGRLTEAWGIDGGHPLYGGGFAALAGGLSRWMDFSPDAVFFLHLGMASAAVPLLWLIARLLLGPGPWPLVAGLALALLPPHLRLSGSEAMHIDVLTLELAAVLAAVASTRVEGMALSALWALVAALATGFVAHVRPEAMAFAAVPALWLLAHGAPRRLPAIGLAAGVVAMMVGVRALDVLALGTSGAIQLGKLVEPDFWVQVLVPQVGTPGSWNATNTFLQLRLTPPVLPLLVLASLWSPRRGLLAWLALWAAVTGLPVLPKSWPLIDALRLQLPLQAPLLLAAALGARELVSRPSWPGWPRWTVPLGVGLVALPYLPGVRTPWAVHEEFRWLRTALPELPDGATVLYDDASPHHDAFGRWAQAQSPRTTWVGIDAFLSGAPTSSVLLAYQGVSCALQPAPLRDPPPSHCGRLSRHCTLLAVQAEQTGMGTDVDVALMSPPTIGFHEVVCDKPGGTH